MGCTVGKGGPPILILYSWVSHEARFSTFDSRWSAWFSLSFQNKAFYNKGAPCGTPGHTSWYCSNVKHSTVRNNNCSRPSPWPWSSTAMVEVILALAGHRVATFDDGDGAGLSVKTIKKSLAWQIGVPRFRLRLLHNNLIVDDSQTFTTAILTLVILRFEPPDREKDEDLMATCKRNDVTLLEMILSCPRNPDFEDAHGATPPLSGSSFAWKSRMSVLTSRSQGWRRARLASQIMSRIAFVRRGLRRAPGCCSRTAWTPCQPKPWFHRWWRRPNTSFHRSRGRASRRGPIAVAVLRQQRPSQDQRWRRTSFHSGQQQPCGDRSISMRVWRLHRSSHDRHWGDAPFHGSLSWSPRSCSSFGGAQG